MLYLVMFIMEWDTTGKNAICDSRAHACLVYSWYSLEQ